MSQHVREALAAAAGVLVLPLLAIFVTFALLVIFAFFLLFLLRHPTGHRPRHPHPRSS